MMDSNLMTAKSLEANPRIQAKPRTMKTINDFEPAGLNSDPFTAVVDIVGLTCKELFK
jgi:hypothetical protein